jgi:hypothetical protein
VSILITEKSKYCHLKSNALRDCQGNKMMKARNNKSRMEYKKYERYMKSKNVNK